MKTTRFLCLLAFVLLCLSAAHPSQAQWAYKSGTYTTDPATLPDGTSVASSDTSCGCTMTANGSVTVSYQTKLYWSGTGTPTTGASIKAVASVNGSTGARSGAGSSAIAALPVHASKSGNASGGNSYAPPDGWATSNNQFAQTLTASLSCGIYGADPASATAQIYFQFF